MVVTNWHRKLKNVWVYDRVVRLFGKERLEQWKDQIAEYWERTIDGINQKQLLRALVQLYGMKEGKKLLRGSRSDQVKAIINGEARRLVDSLVAKVDRIVEGQGDVLKASELTLEEHPYSEAVTIHEGVTTRHDVDGIICITGRITAHHEDGSTSAITVFSRWISHPFWQYSGRTKVELAPTTANLAKGKKHRKR